MDMKTCSTCRHWKRGLDDVGDSIEDDFYSKVTYMGACTSPKTVYVGQGSNLYAKDILGFYDYEGVQAGVITGEAFGCIHHQQN